MKIAFVISYMQSGGSERVVANLTNEFVNLGHEAYILMIDCAESDSHYNLDDRVHLKALTKNGNGIHSMRWISIYAKYLSLRQCVKEIMPDVVISLPTDAHIFTFLACRGLNIPYIVSERNNPTKYSEGRVKHVLRDYAFKKADGCVFQTRGARECYPKHIGSKSRIIPNPTVLSYIPNGVIKRDKKIAAMGRLVDEKNYALMINAFSLFLDKNQGYKLIICGEGLMRDSLKQLVDALGLSSSVKFVGNLKNPHEQIYNATAYVLSSNSEGMPNALLEAMALGIPSVSTNCPPGGPADLIENNENGILVPVGDAAAMANALDRIANDPEFANKLSANSLKMREKHSVANIARLWLEYIETLVHPIANV